MANLTVASLDNGAIDLDTISEFVNSKDIDSGSTIYETETREGEAIPTLKGVINNLGWDISLGNFASSITVTSSNQVLTYDGGQYRTTEDLPYTTDAETPSFDSGEWLSVSDGVLTGIARSLNVSDSQVIYSTDTTTVLDDVLYIYNASTQITYGAPALTTTGETITSISGSELTTSTAEAYTLQGLATANALTPLDFGAAGDGSTYDNVGLLLYDAYCIDNSLDFDGLGLTYATTSIELSCGTYKNASFVPTSTHIGDGPTFNVNSESGVCTHENVKVTGYTNSGAKISRNSYSDVPTFISIGANNYSYNGNKVQTTTTEDVAMTTDYVISVDDSSIFSSGDNVYIGDGLYEVDSISGDDITLVNDGTQATLSAGSRNPFLTGQFVTLNGDGKNGITIGDGGDGWNLDIRKGSITADYCGWFGIFHWANSRAGIQELDTVHASYCGYIGIGLGYTNYGYARNCITEYNGNNGIDTLSSTSSFSMHGGISRYNGVDGVYSGSNSAGEIAKVYDYDCRSNKRLGFLLNASTVAAAYTVHDVDARDNEYRSFTLTGCGVGTINNCKFGGTTFGNSAYMEGKSSCAGQQNHSIIDCLFSDNVTSDDIGGNFTDYTDSSFGFLNINNSFKEDGEQATADTFGVSSLSKSSPLQYLTVSASSSSVSAGSLITLTVTTKRPYDTSIFDNISSLVKFSSFSESTMLTQSGLTSVSRTAGAEVLTGLSHWWASPNFGVVTYNLSMDSASSKYISVEVDGYKKMLSLEWV